MSPEGVDYTPTLKSQDVDYSKFSLTNELLRCDDCGGRWNRDEFNRASELPKRALYWETGPKNTEVPIICPVCMNNEYFVRTVARLTVTEEYVTLESGKATVTDVGADLNPDSGAALIYRCAHDGCTGSVVVDHREYVLTPTDITD